MSETGHKTDRQADDDTYNGWVNYATWNVNLWLSNEEAHYRRISRAARQARNMATYQNDDDPDDAPETFHEEEATTNLADEISDYVQGCECQEHGRPFHFGDLDGIDDLRAVNWEEIASAWLED